MDTRDTNQVVLSGSAKMYVKACLAQMRQSVVDNAILSSPVIHYMLSNMQDSQAEIVFNMIQSEIGNTMSWNTFKSMQGINPSGPVNQNRQLNLASMLREFGFEWEFAADLEKFRNWRNQKKTWISTKSVAEHSYLTYKDSEILDVTHPDQKRQFFKTFKIRENGELENAYVYPREKLINFNYYFKNNNYVLEDRSDYIYKDIRTYKMIPKRPLFNVMANRCYKTPISSNTWREWLRTFTQQKWRKIKTLIRNKNATIDNLKDYQVVVSNEPLDINKKPWKYRDKYIYNTLKIQDSTWRAYRIKYDIELNNLVFGKEIKRFKDSYGNTIVESIIKCLIKDSILEWRSNLIQPVKIRWKKPKFKAKIVDNQSRETDESNESDREIRFIHDYFEFLRKKRRLEN